MHSGGCENQACILQGRQQQRIFLIEFLAHRSSAFPYKLCTGVKGNIVPDDPKSESGEYQVRRNEQNAPWIDWRNPLD